MDLSDIKSRIKRSVDYGALDHKWLARHSLSLGAVPKEIVDMAYSAFDYYQQYQHTIKSDPSLAALTSMCSKEDHINDVDLQDNTVFHLSNVFNQIIDSTRVLHKCYDCGTNARAMFLKLIETHRGINFITHEEQQRMKHEYLVKRTGVAEEIKKCKDKLLSLDRNSVFIMSLAIDSFGHVWVIEKIVDSAKVRYHHYQTCLRSHLFLDFLEYKDYGRYPDQSLDLDDFFADLTDILTVNEPWIDSDYRLFAKLFAFLPVSSVLNPNPGFSFTWLSY